MAKRRVLIGLAGVALLAGSGVAWGLWQRRHPSALPYSQRVFLDLPRPFLRRETLLALLAPGAGERMLEVGAGLGYYSLPVARALAPDGVLTVLDIDSGMLNELGRRATAAQIVNIKPMQGDAQVLPIPDAMFDGMFLVATLGELPDQERALRECHRALRPGGCLVVGEGQPDPHCVVLSALCALAERAGLRYAGHRGGWPGYVARFEREGGGVLG